MVQVPAGKGSAHQTKGCQNKRCTTLPNYDTLPVHSHRVEFDFRALQYFAGLRTPCGHAFGVFVMPRDFLNSKAAAISDTNEPPKYVAYNTEL